jgi:hypothetical protein
MMKRLEAARFRYKNQNTVHILISINSMFLNLFYCYFCNYRQINEVLDSTSKNSDPTIEAFQSDPEQVRIFMSVDEFGK